MIHNWEKKGYAEAQQIFTDIYEQTRTRRINQKGQTKIENVIGGKLLYMKMVKGENDSTFKRLNERYLKLMEKQFGIKLDAVTETYEPDDTLSKSLSTLINLLNTE